MNGMKAKMLRALAGGSQTDRSYHGTNVREKSINHPTQLNADGTPMVLFRYRTATYKLNQGARLLNKMLKKNYLQALRNPSASMIVA